VAVLDDGTMQMFLWNEGRVEKVLSSSLNYNVPEDLEFPTDPLPVDWSIEKQFEEPYLSYRYHNIVMVEDCPLIYQYFCRLHEELDRSKFFIEVSVEDGLIIIKPHGATIYLTIRRGRLLLSKADGNFTPYLDYIFHIIEGYV
jgi:hypothetical protein